MNIIYFSHKISIFAEYLHHTITDSMELKIKKGLNLTLEGAVQQGITPLEVPVSLCAVVPDDFHGFIPKVEAKEGTDVAAGSPILFDKVHPEVKLVSPVAGRVKAVVRGERRKILRVEIEAASTTAVQPRFSRPSNSAEARSFLATSGLLAMFRQRPYDIVPSPDSSVRDIFVTAFDCAPLASHEVSTGALLFDSKDFEAGVAVLNLITEGKVYISRRAGTLSDIKGAEMIDVEGNYPASNVSVQIAAVSPVNKGETVWTLDIVTLGRIGRLATTGVVDFTTVVALCGPEVESPALLKTTVGASIAPLIEGRLKKTTKNLRVISGNVFTGTAVNPEDGFLHAPYRQITVIAEGNDVDEFMGWASLAPNKMSESRTFPGHFFKRLFTPDARLHGGRRAMIMSGQYDKVMPMDILTEYLVKAILSHNIEDMEKLGIYEVAPEDFAAAEYVDTSKLPLQQIVRDGLDYLRKELE